MTDDMPEYTVISGRPDAPASWGTEIEYDDDEINRCRNDPDRPCGGFACPAHSRCTDLALEEDLALLEELALEPPEEVE